MSEGKESTMKNVVWCLALCLVIGLAAAQGQDLKIDFSQTNGPVQEGYQAYRADHEVAATFTAQSFEAFGATVTILPTWAAGATPQAMQMIQRPDDDASEAPDLVRDWIGTDGRQPGDPMTLTISGLPEGTYSWVSLHHDPQDQTGIFDVTVNDAAGSTTTTDVDISDVSILALADMTTFTTTITSNGTDPVTLVFTRTSPAGDNTITTTFFVMNSFEMVSLDTGAAMFPSPAHQATDVLIDGTILSWSPSRDAVAHEVYFGTDADAIDDATTASSLFRGRQNATSFDPGPLELGQTYYWRVDEVAADGTITKGTVWTFAAEPITYLLTNLTATASSPNDPGMGPERAIDGSGLVDGQHSVQDADMWLVVPAAGEPVWIQFDFDRVYKISEARIWNYNMIYELFLGFGLKDVTIEYATDANDWTALGDIHLAQASGLATEAGQAIDFGGVAARSVRINVTSNYGGTKYGLSEVQFFYIPAFAREPDPELGAEDVAPDVVLSWRAGRDATSHEVYLDTDEQAVVDGTAPAHTAATDSYDAGALALGQTYYWRVDEVNPADAIGVWEGDLWSFTIQDSIVVDDFESYTGDADNEVYSAWADGYGTSTNGSQVGYEDPPYVEEVIVHGGGQSMPFNYGRNGIGTSEATRTFNPPQDWTAYGVKALILWFYGDSANTATQMYVKVNGKRVDYDGDAGNVLLKPWQVWYIDLSDFVGVNLTSVNEMTIGCQGGAGLLLFDDVALSPHDRQLVTPVEPASDGLVAHYAFEGDAADSAGNNDGTLVGAPQFAAGKTGQAIVLNGSSDYVQVEGSFPLTEYTYAVWFQVTGGEGDRDIVSAYTTDQGHGILLEVNGTGGLRYLHRAPTGTTGDNSIRSTATFDDGEWHHVAVVKSADTMTLYANGVSVGSMEEPDAFEQPLAKISIGVLRDESLGRYFAGAFDEAYLYDRALSQSEVAWLAGRTQPFDGQ
jgi:hypothetical protein